MYEWSSARSVNASSHNPTNTFHILQKIHYLVTALLLTTYPATRRKYAIDVISPFSTHKMSSLVCTHLPPDGAFNPFETKSSNDYVTSKVCNEVKLQRGLLRTHHIIILLNLRRITKIWIMFSGFFKVTVLKKQPWQQLKNHSVIF